MRKTGEKRVTSKDVAKAAGVSQTTVVHALRPPPNVRMRSETRERVLKAAAELGYRPNFMGKALVSGRTYTVGLLQPSFDSLLYSFYHKIIMGMAEAMAGDNYYLLNLFLSDEAGWSKVLEQGRVDGVIILSSSIGEEMVEKVLARGGGVPTVMVNAAAELGDRRAFGAVRSDHERVMAEVIDGFKTAGRRVILAVNDHRRDYANVKLQQAFVELIDRHAGDGLIGTTMIPSKEHFADQIRSALRKGQRWEAVFTDGALWAEIFVEAAREAGLAPGEDFQISVTSTEESHSEKIRSVASCHVQQPKLMGSEAWKLLSAMIDGGKVPEREVRVPYVRV